ncbi:MAG: hypothetical protein WA840_02470 [Caulobacteraceae bacterium]
MAGAQVKRRNRVSDQLLDTPISLAIHLAVPVAGYTPLTPRTSSG